uniref:Transmembrane protein n=1 Tax=Mesocestoides corti TaxID=53468 RepID=A0A5K3EHF1_MESCO
MSPRFPRSMTRRYIFHALFLLIISASITFGSYAYREYNGGIYCITAGPCVVSIVLFIQGLLYCTMPLSTVLSGAAGVD